MRIPKLALTALLVAGLATIGVSTASATDSAAKKAPGPAVQGTVHAKGEAAPDAYGINATTRISVLSYAFQGNDPFNDQISDDGESYRAFTSNTSLGFSASISIPAGASITEIGFDNCDNDATGTMTMRLFDRYGDHLNTIVADVASTDAPFCAV